MKTFPASFLGVILLLTGCASSVPDVTTHTHPISRLRTDLIPENLLDTPAPAAELIWLNASRVFRNRTQYDYFLEVRYLAREERGFLDIAPGDSLVIRADDRFLAFHSSGSMNTRRNRKGMVTEDAIYLVTATDLMAIAEARDVKVRVIGRNGTVDREFAPGNFERFRKFVHHYSPESFTR